MHRDRAWRRAQRERKIQNIKRWMKDRPWWFDPRDPTADTEEFYRNQAVRRHQHPQGCSSFCCGNPRKWFKAATMQEIRHADIAREEFQEEGLRAHVVKPHKEG